MLQRSTASLQHMLRSLPAELHHLVAESFFTPATTQRVLTLGCDTHHYGGLARELEAPQLCSSLKALHVSSLSYLLHGSTSFLAAVMRTGLLLTHLSLHIQMDVLNSDNKLALYEEQFWDSRVRTRTLTSIELSADVAVKQALSGQPCSCLNVYVSQAWCQQAVQATEMPCAAW